MKRLLYFQSGLLQPEVQQLHQMFTESHSMHKYNHVLEQTLVAASICCVEKGCHSDEMEGFTSIMESLYFDSIPIDEDLFYDIICKLEYIYGRLFGTIEFEPRNIEIYALNSSVVTLQYEDGNTMSDPSQVELF